MTDAAPASPDGLPTGRRRLLARFWPVLWLVSIAVPAWQQASTGTLRGIGLGVLLVAASVVLGWVAVRSPRRITLGLPTLDRTAAVALLAGLACALPCLWWLGIRASALAFFLLVAAGLTLDLWPTLAAAGIVAGIVYTLSGNPLWEDTQGVAVGLLATGAGAALGRRASVRSRDAKLATDYAHQMELNDERNRMARDLHDILGHSLTVITLKTELASKLMDADPAAAKRELAEVQSLSRSALADVRSTVNSYRELSLAAELARATSTLAASGVRADLPLTVDAVAPELRELFAWAVREGVTNVVRHAHASHCRITLEPTSMAVVDDGTGISGTSDGHGISGLRERCSASGVDVDLRPGPYGTGTELRLQARTLDSPLTDHEPTEAP